jgi:hypothetical protein
LHAPQSRIIYGCSVRCPYRPCGGDQASQSFLGGNAEPFSSASRLADKLGRLMDRRVGWLQRPSSVAFARARLVPIDVIVLTGCRHSLYSATEIVVNASYVRVIPVGKRQKVATPLTTAVNECNRLIQTVRLKEHKTVRSYAPPEGRPLIFSWEPNTIRAAPTRRPTEGLLPPMRPKGAA